MLTGEQPRPFDPTMIKQPGNEPIGSTNSVPISRAYKEGFAAGLMEPGWQVPCCGYAPSDHKNEQEWCKGYDGGEIQRTANQGGQTSPTEE